MADVEGQGMVPVEGQVIRVKPGEADVRDLPLLKGLPDNKQQSKLQTIRAGGELMDEYPPLPDERPCRDIFWLILFLATVVVVFVYGAMNLDFMEKKDEQLTGMTIGTEVKDVDKDLNLRPTRLLSAALAAFLGALATANAYLFLAHVQTNCVVWTSLILAPFLLIALGVSSLCLGSGDNLITGGILILAGVLKLTCIFCCWKRYIPFTVKMTEVVADVINRNCCLLVVPLVGALMSAVWSVACVVVMIGFCVKHKVFEQERLAAESSNGDNLQVSPLNSAVMFVYTLVYVWGAGVAYNVCHMTTCGVFGRWYYKGLVSDSDSESSNDSVLAREQKVRSPIMPSLQVALTTSLGSNCCGSFLVAVVRAVQTLAENAQDVAANNGAWVTCVCLCVLNCFLQCIGDMLEYFNEWAYVQCAVRGTSFFQSAKITYSLMTCANMKYVIADLLLDSVVGMGGLLCGLVAALCGGVTEYALSGNVHKFVLGLVLGLLIGLPIGMSALSTLSSGAKTIMACWADDPEPLLATHPEIAQEFEARIRNGIAQGGAKKRRRWF